MRRLFCLMFSFVLAFSVFSFSGCTSEPDLSALEKKIEELEKLVTESDVSILNEKITSLEKTVAALEAALNTSNETNLLLKAQVDSLSATVTTLSETLNNGLLGTEALKEELDKLKTKISDYDALKLKLEDLESKFNSSSEANEALKAEIDAIKETLADYSSIKLKIADLEEKQIECENQNTLLQNQIDAINASLTEMTKTLNSSSAKIAELEKEVAALNKSMQDANAKILLLEGVIAGDPNKTYGINETFTFVSNGMQLFSITIDEAWMNVNDDVFAHFTYTNINYPNGYTLDEIFDAKLNTEKWTQNNSFNRYNNIDKHIIRIGESFSSKNDLPLWYGLGTNKEPGKRKIYFGFYNYEADNNSLQSFIPFVCFEIDFQPKV